MTTFLKILITFFFFSCGDNEFEKYGKLGDLKFLAIHADQPEIDGSSSVPIDITLTPYISDLKSNGRELNVAIFVCEDTGVTSGETPECLENPQPYPNNNRFDTSSLSSTNFTGAMTPVTITIANPASFLANKTEQQKFNGVNLLVAFVLTEGNQTISAFKSLIVSERKQLNTNPQLGQILFNNSQLNTRLTDDGELRFTVNQGAENYQTQTSNQTLQESTERLLLTFFFTNGEINPYRILENGSTRFRAKEVSSDQSQTIVAVLRDMRGGVDVQIYHFD